MCVNDMSEVKLIGRIILFVGNSKIKVSNACCKLLHNVLHLFATIWYKYISHVKMHEFVQDINWLYERYGIDICSVSAMKY